LNDEKFLSLSAEDVKNLLSKYIKTKIIKNITIVYSDTKDFLYNNWPILTQLLTNTEILEEKMNQDDLSLDDLDKLIDQKNYY